MILVTGSSGIVGTRLVFDLLNKGENVRALKRPTTDLDFVLRVFEFYDPERGRSLFDRIQWVEGDVLDYQSMEEAMIGAHTVYHAAALVSYSPKDQSRLLAINGDGTANAVNAAVTAGVGRFCHISSVAALGSTANGAPVDEITPRKTTDRRSTYGASKFLAEREVWRAAAEESLSVVIVNPSIVLGPAKPDQSSGMLFSMLRKGIAFYPRGTTGIVDVRDVAWMAIELTERGVEGERFILNSENLSQRQLLNLAAEVFGNTKPRFQAGPSALELAWRSAALAARFSHSSPKITKETARSASRHNRYDTSKVRETLETGFIPVVDALRFYRPFLLGEE